MAIVPADVLVKLSEKSGTAGNQNAGTPAGSLGKYISTTPVVDASIHNIFGIVSGDDNQAGAVHYRLIFFHNNHATLTWEAPVAWLSAQTPLGADVAIALDGVGVTPIGQVAAQADEVANEDTAPTGETFTSPTTKAGGLSLANVPPGEVVGIWLRRTGLAGAALDNDDVTVKFEGDSAA